MDFSWVKNEKPLKQAVFRRFGGEGEFYFYLLKHYANFRKTLILSGFKLILLLFYSGTFQAFFVEFVDFSWEKRAKKRPVKSGNFQRGQKEENSIVIF